MGCCCRHSRVLTTKDRASLGGSRLDQEAAPIRKWGWGSSVISGFAFLRDVRKNNQEEEGLPRASGFSLQG